MTDVHESMKQMLFDAADVLERENKEWWLEAGTLLGAIREKGFIEWEHDLDIGMWWQEDDLAYKKKLAATFQELGYNTYFSDSHIHIYPKEKDNEACLDINFYKKQNAIAVRPLYIRENEIGAIIQRFIWSCFDWNNFQVKRPSWKHHCLNFCVLVPTLLFYLLPFPLRKKLLPKIAGLQESSFFDDRSIVYPMQMLNDLFNIQFMRRNFPVPRNSEAVLEYKYGADWRKPNKNWDAKKQDKSLIGNKSH